jgi:hypothetical protein
MSDSKQSNKLNRFFAEFIAKLRKWLGKIGSPIRISRRFVRQLIGTSRGQRKAKNGKAGGFILPTVTLVTLVVTLLVVTMVARSSDRARSAANARSEQVFRSAATPIVDRARAKIEALLSDDKLPRTTPPELVLDTVITGDSGKYTFPDETRLQLVYNIDKDSSGVIKVGDSKIEKREYASTAWKFPIDTDNNGLFDSYGLYSILFRARTETNRPISPLEARSLPMDESSLTGACVATGGVTNIATQEGWSPSSDNKLKKAFFVYAVTVPIKDQASFPASASGKYETYNGTSSISAIELQQDRARSPQNNNAVWFEGDTELVNVATFRLNGRVYSAGNLMLGAGKNLNITFYQVSSSGDSTTDPKKFGSCYYEKKNSEILVAGNVVEGDAVFSDVTKLSPDTSTGTGGNVKVHLFQGVGVRPDNSSTGTKLINETNQSVDSSVAGNLSKDLALNDLAYSIRIKALVDKAITRGSFSAPGSFAKTLPAKTLESKDLTLVDPPSVVDDIVKRILDEGLSSDADVKKARREALTSYFKERTRKVSFGEVPLETPETILSTDVLFNELIVDGQTNNELVPRRDWALPSYKNAATFGRDVTDFTIPTTTPTNNPKFDGSVIYGTGAGSLKLLTANSDTNLALSASEPATVTSANKEFLLGDRVLVGNNLPAKWLKLNTINSNLEFVGDTENSNITSDGSIKWDGSSTSKRYRNTRAFPLSNLGVSDRGGFWELSAAADPSIVDSSTTPIKKQDDSSPRSGGLRVVTNAGIYSRLTTKTFLPRFRTGYSDDLSTTGFDESIVPLWNGSPKDNPITTVNELNFGNFVVWSDSLPMTGLPTDTRKGDLQMRANAIYHYKYSAFDSLNSSTYQLPIACVSSYYDPTNSITAKNGKAATSGNPALPWNYDADGRSDNGIVYDVQATASSITGAIGYTASTGLFTYGSGAEDPSDKNVSIKNRLSYQANLMFPNGRFANESLRNVLIKLSDSANVGKLTLSEQSTLDSNICALTILDGTSTPQTGSPPKVQTGIELPHGTFRESAFLNGREVKSLNRNESLTEAASGNDSTNGLSLSAKNRGDIYDLQIEQRQPLEVRVTDIDIDRLRGSKVTGQPNNNSVAGVPTEYLLPYSGLVYATREDALADLSYYDVDGSGNPQQTDNDTRKAFSPLDFRLDPTRRPSAIRLINGYRLWRSALTTANLGNVDGTLPISDATSYNSTYKWTEITKGEKGLTLISNLPVYIKAQFDPKVGVMFNTANATTSSNTAPAFNKHTQEEFTLKLNEAVPNITDPALLDTPDTVTALDAVWDNFYTRYAGDSSTPTNKLNPDFACRPYINTACTNGDEWRPATIIADSATVLSASFRDGYRADGDYDLRNNAFTSTSLNWQSQLNPNSEKNKNSNYVIQRRKMGFFNNDYVTSYNWMNIFNSDRQRWTATQNSNWMGNPQTAAKPWTGYATTTDAATAVTSVDTNASKESATIPQNGNMSSYNANGVTPVQRRVNTFNEYGMEMCRKLPLSECTFADWVKADAGTTVLPSIGVDAASTTPPTAPRYVAPTIDGRFARRVSFLRYDDLYKDGNMQLVMAGRCDSVNNRNFPIPIAVQNGNVATGYTYPKIMGNLEVPFEGSTATRQSTYGTVPCPDKTLSVSITGDSNNVEGRRVTFHKNTVSNTKNFSLQDQLGTDSLPNIDTNSWINDTDTYNSTNPTLGTVTNRDDVAVPETAARLSVPSSGVNDPPITPPVDDTEYSTNNAIYRRFNFTIRLNNPELLTNGVNVATRVTIYPVGGSAVPALTVDNLDPTRTLEANTSTLTRKFNTGVTAALRDAASTAVAAVAGPPAIPAIPVGGAGGDYINRIYSAGVNPSPVWNAQTKNSAAAIWDTTNVGPLGTVLQRLPIDTGTLLPTTVANPSRARSSTPESAKPEDAKCPADQYCTIISWTGSGNATAPANDPWDKVVTVLVVRDSANENNESFEITLDNVKRSDGGSITYLPDTQIPNRNRYRTGTIQVNNTANDPPTPSPCFPAGGSATTNRRVGGYDDRESIRPKSNSQCTTPTGGGGSTGGGGVLPGYFLLANGHIGAAYPFRFLNSDGTPTTPAQPIRTFSPPPTAGADFDAGRFVWGVDKGVGAATTIDSPEENVFPDIPSEPGALGAIPMLPADPALIPPYPTTDSSNGSFRQGMTRNIPSGQNRALWYRTIDDSGLGVGTSCRLDYRRDRDLFINNLSFPAIDGSNCSNADKRANLNAGSRLLLPETVCIDAVTGRVDERCVNSGTDYAMGANSTAATTFLNLNLPYNPHFPSIETSAIGTAAANRTPASAYAICGATGNSYTFQPTQRTGRTDITGTNASPATCPADQRTAITNFLGTTTGSGSGLLSAALNPNDAANFKGLVPDDSKKRDIAATSVKTGTVSQVDVALRAINTYADNRVHVYDFKKQGFGSLTGSKRTLTGTLTLRANCIALNDTPSATVCAPNSRHLGPSPVFILRADAAEDIEFDGLKLKLEGVDPNNVFWIFPKVTGADNVIFKASDPNFPNVVTGNFIGTMPATGVTVSEANSTDLAISDPNTSFRGVRFLGFRSLLPNPSATPPITGINSSVVMAAISSVDQPELIPILQLQFPNPTDANNTRFVDSLQPLLYDGTGKRKDSGVNGVPKTNQGQWTIRPVRSEVNAYFVAGITPSRNGMSYRTSNTASTSSSVSYDSNGTISSAGVAGQSLTNLGETGGGLVNFIRLLENWEAVPLKITGGFLQNTRSVFSTAPFLPTAPFVSEISGATFPPFSDIQTLFINPVRPNIGMSGYSLAYQSTTTSQRIPYYSAPIRLWGYDVALLTQQPDRFAERFATPIPGANEFFREVSADDNWVKTLLCALEPNDPTVVNTATNSTVNIGSTQQFGTKPQNYTKRVLRGGDLNSGCTTTTYGGSTVSYDPAT